MSKRTEELYPLVHYGEGGWNNIEAVDNENYIRLSRRAAYEQAEKDLGWHSVDECLPEIDEEVIVLVDNIHGKVVEGANYICFGHIVDRRYAMDYNGWNIPGVRFWMPCPKIPEECHDTNDM